MTEGIIQKVFNKFYRISKDEIDDRDRAILKAVERQLIEAIKQKTNENNESGLIHLSWLIGDNQE